MGVLSGTQLPGCSGDHPWTPSSGPAVTGARGSPAIAMESQIPPVLMRRACIYPFVCWETIGDLTSSLSLRLKILDVDHWKPTHGSVGEGGFIPGDAPGGQWDVTVPSLGSGLFLSQIPEFFAQV